VSAEIVLVGPPLEDPLLDPLLLPLPLPLPALPLLLPPLLPLPLDEALPAPLPLLLPLDPLPDEEPVSPGCVMRDESPPGEAPPEHAAAKPETRTSAPRKGYERESERMDDLFGHRSYKSCASVARTAVTTEFHTFWR